MKRIVALCIFLILFTCTTGFADHLSVNEERTIKIGGDDNFPPFEYVDANGTYKGFNVDITHAVALETGMDIEFVPMTWHEATTTLQNGDIDVVQGMKYSKGREELYLFSEPYVKSSLSIFVKKNSAIIISLSDLRNKRVAIQKNDIANNLIEEWMHVDVVETENQIEALELLVNDEVEAYLGNRLVGLYSIQKQGYQNVVKMTGGLINAEDYGFAMNKENSTLVEDFNEGLARIKKNGTYDRIYSKWFGDEIKPPIAYFKNILLMAGLIAVVFGLVFVSIVRINLHLKKEVEKQTADLKSETLYKAQIIDSIFSGLVTCDKELIIKSVNKKAKEILHIDAENHLDCSLAETNLLPFLDIKSFKDILTSDNAVMDEEKRCKIQGSERIIEYNIYPLLSNLETLEGWTVTFRDVTFARQILRKAMLNDKMESLGRLTAGIAHEIRNPLASIRTYLDILPEKYDDERYRNKVSKDIPVVIDKLNESINSLLDFAKPRDSYPTYFSLSEAIHESYSLMRKDLENNAIKVELDLKYNDYVYMDKQHLQQVILNLLINAIDAVKGHKSPCIRIDSAKEGYCSVFDISNNGHKIPDEELEKIFEPFYTTKSQGTGLGLSICHQLINQNGGDIKVSTKSIDGSSFRVILPFSEFK